MTKQNNFNIMRLIFASTVIISHSYPLTQKPDFFAYLTKNQIDLGTLSVNVFFIISGFLIFKSLWTSKSVLNYLWKRVIRLFPALFVMLLFSLAIVLLVNTSTNIFKQPDFYSYLPKNLSLYLVQFNINNVFTTNPYPNVVNGSLWSLSFEFTMYLIIIPFFWLKKSKKNISLAILITLFIASYYCSFFNPKILYRATQAIKLDSGQFYRLLTWFSAGAIISFINFRKTNYNIPIIILTGLLISTIFFEIFNYAAPFILPILIILTGISYNKYLWNFTEKIGDLSYGIYIYGFLIQQTLMHYYDFHPIALMFTALSLTAILAYLSWHLIEKKSLQYKDYI